MEITKEDINKYGTEKEKKVLREDVESVKELLGYMNKFIEDANISYEKGDVKLFIKNLKIVKTYISDLLNKFGVWHDYKWKN